MRRTITTLLIAALGLTALRADAQERWTTAGGLIPALEQGYDEIHPAVEAVYEMADVEQVAEVSYQPTEPPTEEVQPPSIEAPPLAVEAPPIAAIASATENPPAPAPGGGHYYEPYAGPNPPCTFNTYWDLTGGRSPTQWWGALAYGPECHAISAKLEWLLWFSQGRDIPALASRFTDIVAGDAVGVVDIFGDQTIGENVRNGGRVSLAGLLPDQATWAEGRFWILEDSSERFFVDSGNEPRLGRPFFDVTTGEPAVLVLSNPGELAGGSIDVLSKNDLMGVDAWLRRTWWDDGRTRIDLMAGYQFTRLDDSLFVVSSGTNLTTNLQNTRFDLFETENEFHGGSLGVVAEFRRKSWSVEVLGKLGLGNMREQVQIDGATIQTDFANGTTVISQGGLLALPTNIGVYERNRFVVVPELNINGVVNLSPAWRLTVGYSLIYWGDSVLAGDQIDTNINPTLVPGLPGPPAGFASPQFSFNSDNFWVQGISMGAEYRW